MQEIWTKYAPYWHICTAISAFIYVTLTWVHDVSGYGKRLDSVESKQEEQATSIAVVSSKIDDIWRAMHLDRTKK